LFSRFFKGISFALNTYLNKVLPMKSIRFYTFLAFLTITLPLAGQHNQKGLNIFGNSLNLSNGEAVTMPDPNTVALAGGQNSRAVRVYKWNGANWTQKGNDIIDGPPGSFGFKISMPDSNTIAVGHFRDTLNGVNSGSAKIYRWSGSDWVQKGQNLVGQTSYDYFGWSVSMYDSNTVTVGAFWGDYAKIYEWSGVAWIQKGSTIIGQNISNLGQSVSMPSASVVGIGVPGYNYTQVYHYINNAWVAKGSQLYGNSTNEFFGAVVDMPDTNTLAVGADSDYGPGGLGWKNGYVRVFRWNNSDWQQKGADIEISKYVAYQGHNISMADSNTLAIGVERSNVNGPSTGIVQILKWNGSSWIQVGSNIAGDSIGDLCGYAVSMPDTNIVAVGFSGLGVNGVVKVFEICYPDTTIHQYTACDTFTWIDGVTYTASTDSAHVIFTNSQGCDSVVALQLDILNTTFTDTIYACDSYTWIDGSTYTTSNTTATHTITNAAGCDSVITLHLILGYSNTGIDSIIACDSYTWIDGVTYTTSNNTATHTLTNITGCDSTVTLNLTINYSSSSAQVISTCAPYTWINGFTYTTSNNAATYTVINSVGCDSTISLDLTILSSSSTEVVFACDNYTWIDGITYNSSNNTATQTFTNAVGCDSTITLDLTINTSPIVTTTTYNTPFGSTITADHWTGSYQWLDCENAMTPIAGETGSSFTTTENGSYAVAITENDCSDTSDCVSISIVGINELNSAYLFDLYPSPNEGNFKIQFNQIQQKAEITITDVNGRMVLRQVAQNKAQVELELDEPAGIYFVKVETASDYQVMKIVLQ